MEVSYQVLARRYRPTKFTDLMGQEVLVQTLTNAIAAGRIAHAFIFTGVRGVGKTTSARLLARALNCEGRGDVPTIDPCGTCAQCIAIGEDRHVDVMEVDAASRTGVDDVRELLEGVHYKPAFGRYKVYIIDEVHMLSKSAFNALLKTLEEPPAHVKFIFATTEIRKVPITVLSRCQRFDLKRVGADVLVPYFTTLLEKEKVSFEPEALRLICKAADGSVRDGQSLLEQAIVGTSGGSIAENFVKDMLGLGDRSTMVELLKHLLEGHVVESLALVRDLLQKGASPRQILQDLMEIIHALSIIKVTGSKAEDDLAIPSAALEQCQKMVEVLSIPVLTRTWQICLKGMEEVVTGPLPECALEMVLIRVTHVKAFLGEEIFEKAPEKVATPQGDVQANGQAITQAIIKIATVEEMMALFIQHGEFILADRLKNAVLFQEFREGHGTLHILEGEDKNFLREVSRLLTTWTGISWQFELSDKAIGRNLSQEEKVFKQEQRKAVENNPSVQKILETFPGATVE
jgi:DNA polymerase-3 subunit gamma/tau